MGLYGVGKMSVWGPKLLTFCLVNDLLVGGTLHDHPESMKMTWTDFSGRYQHQKDHVSSNV